MSTTSEIVERLRNGVLYDDEGEILRVATKALMRQAAEKITELERENARMRELLTWALVHIEPIEADMYFDLGAMAQESHDGAAPISPHQKQFMENLAKARALAGRGEK